MKGADLVAGLSVAGLMLPEAVAYAGIAGLPPSRAILAAVAGSCVYALVGRSRFAVVSPTSSSAAILAAALAAMPGDAAMRGMLATVAVAMAGLLFLAAGAARLGALTGFIARPVLRGFAFGLAVTIIAKQLPLLVGVPVSGTGIFRLMWQLCAALPIWNGPSVAIGAIALAALLLLRRLPALPGALLVMATGIGASMALDLPAHGVVIVGDIHLELSLPSLPHLGYERITRLAQMVVPLALILFAESWGTMRALALRHNDTIEPDRELAAIGLANLAAAVVQGMPVGAGFSAGSASEAAGAQSRATTLIAAIGLALLVAVATPWIAHLPEPVLAAIVIAALTHALDPAPLLRLWHLDRDQYVALGATLGVILLGVLNGMLFAIGLSILAMIRRMASPQLVELGRLAGGHDYVDISRHPDAVRIAGLAILRPAQPLFFANAERVFAGVEDGVRNIHGLAAIVLSLEESFDIDSTALDALVEFDQRQHSLGHGLVLARVHDRVRDLLPPALAAKSSYSVDDAVQSTQEPR